MSLTGPQKLVSVGNKLENTGSSYGFENNNTFFFKSKREEWKKNQHLYVNESNPDSFEDKK